MEQTIILIIWFSFIIFLICISFIPSIYYDIQDKIKSSYRNHIRYERVYKTRKPFLLYNFKNEKLKFEKVWNLDEVIYAKIGKKIIGHVARNDQWLYNVWVDKKWRRKGIATKLIKLMENDVPFETCWLWGSKNALGFYRSLKKWKDFGQYKIEDKSGIDKEDHLFGIQFKKSNSYTFEQIADSILNHKYKNISWLRNCISSEEGTRQIVLEEISTLDKNGGYKTLGNYNPLCMAYQGNKVILEFRKN